MDLPAQVTFGPITRTDLVRYAGASGDFNPLHHDAEFARAAGLPDVMAHGMYSAGLVASALQRWFGAGSLVRFAIRFRRPVWPGDVLVLRCTAMAPAGDDAADVELSLTHGDEVVLSGSARVATTMGQT
jgi:acyl dehydratase